MFADVVIKLRNGVPVGIEIDGHEIQNVESATIKLVPADIANLQLTVYVGGIKSVDVNTGNEHVVFEGGVYRGNDQRDMKYPISNTERVKP